MNIEVKVITGAKKEEIIKEDNLRYKVKIRVKREKGKANKKLIEYLSKYFNVSKSKIKIIKGEYSNKKIINIDKTKIKS